MFETPVTLWKTLETLNRVFSTLLKCELPGYFTKCFNCNWMWFLLRLSSSPSSSSLSVIIIFITTLASFFKTISVYNPRLFSNITSTIISVVILIVVDGRCTLSGPHTMSFPWRYRTVSAGSEIVGCQTAIAEPDEDGNGEVCFVFCGVTLHYTTLQLFRLA